MIVGYARIGLQNKTVEDQLQKLQRSGCGNIYKDIVKGAKSGRPQFDSMLSMLNSEDQLVVTDLSRLGRSQLDLVNTLVTLKKKKIVLISLKEHVDTRKPKGKSLYKMAEILTQLGKTYDTERYGERSGRARGRVGGRPPKIDAANKEALKELYQNRNIAIADMLKMFNIGKTTLYKYLNEKDNKQK
ncbi:MAG: recombinase family protein [Candidatus Margulisbacteria bacterium]|nr:recombinase family protein [Candidatus Margulisiibacteriota bacterium]